jgi:hypothetical protein
LVSALAAIAGIGLTMLALPSCVISPARSNPPPREIVQANPSWGRSSSGDIVSLSEAKGQILAEVALGSADGVERGTLLRVFDVADLHRLKGMLQVTKIIDERHCAARQIGLYDRLSPLRVNDRTRPTEPTAPATGSAPVASTPAPAITPPPTTAPTPAPSPTPVVSPAPTVVPPPAVATAIRPAPPPAATPAPQPSTHPANPAAPALDDAVVEQFRVQMRAIEAFHDRQLNQLKQERDDALAALRSSTATGAEAGSQLAVNELKRQQEALTARIAALVKDLAEKDLRHAQELGAETERRQALQQRLAELERPRGRTPTPAEGGRNESPLERLARITDELVAERERGVRLEADLTTAQAALTAAREVNTALEQQLRNLAGTDQGTSKLTEELAATRQRLTEAEQQRTALELSRLEAERSLYDLAARVLRLAGSSPETVALQARLRDVLGPQAGDEQSPAKPAPRKAP